MFKKQLVFWVTVIGIILQTSSSAQNQMGLRLDNMSGINAATLNPVYTSNNPYAWDVNIVGFGAFFANNILYLGKTSFSKTLLNANNIGIHPEVGFEQGNDKEILANFYNPAKNRQFGVMSSVLLLPSVSFNFEGGTTIGLFNNVRVDASSRYLPRQSNFYVFREIPFDEKMPLKSFNLQGMAWGEVGLNIAHRIGDYESDVAITLGGNIKYLVGGGTAFFTNGDETVVKRVRDGSFETVAFDALDARFGTSAKGDIGKAHGWGIDLGSQVERQSDREDMPYKWRVSSSLTDLGTISFRKDARVYEIYQRSPFEIKTEDFENLDPNDPRTDALNRAKRRYFAENIKELDRVLPMNLPTAITFAVDVPIVPRVFANMLVVQNFPLGGYSLRRDDFLGLSARYESRWIGGLASLNMLNYQSVHLGMAARLGFLTIGTDDILSHFRQKRFDSSDYYFAVKLHPFKKDANERMRSPFKKRARSYTEKCYKF